VGDCGREAAPTWSRSRPQQGPSRSLDHQLPAYRPDLHLGRTRAPPSPRHTPKQASKQASHLPLGVDEGGHTFSITTRTYMSCQPPLSPTARLLPSGAPRLLPVGSSPRRSRRRAPSHQLAAPAGARAAEVEGPAACVCVVACARVSMLGCELKGRGPRGMCLWGFQRRHAGPIRSAPFFVVVRPAGPTLSIEDHQPGLDRGWGA